MLNQYQEPYSGMVEGEAVGLPHDGANIDQTTGLMTSLI